MSSEHAWIWTSPLRIPRTNLGKRSNPCEYTPSRLVPAKSCAQRKGRSGRKPELHRGRARGHRKLPDTDSDHLRVIIRAGFGSEAFDCIRATRARLPIQSALKFVC